MSNNRRTLNTDLHPKANLALSVPRKMGNRMYSRSDEAEIMAVEVFLLSMMVKSKYSTLSGAIAQ